MRASAPLQVSIRRFGIWRTLVALLLGSSAAALTAWWLGRGASPWDPWRLAVLGSGTALIGLAARSLRCSAMSLRWDTQTWRLGPASAVGEEPWPGHLAVTMDFGAWMLLRFEHDVTHTPRRVTWLPVQRLGIEPQWHALRCAVYSSRPAGGPDGSHAAIRSESKE
jgi:hypothetical protein